MEERALEELISEANSLDVGQGRWLLEASALSEAISEAVLGDPSELAEIRQAVVEAAERAGCDLIVGASPIAERVVHNLNTFEGEPSKALLFELVRVTGATLAIASQELRHLEVVPAALVDVNPTSGSDEVLPVGSILLK